MARTSNIYTRVEPEIKEQAERILSQLGIPMSNAITIFLRQVVMHKGIPFDLKLPQNMPVSIEKLTESEFNTEIEKGFDDIAKGNVASADDVLKRMRQDFGI
ncbi:MAG: type II toxin-antitoxin system RelB/DinJ family antitoxin [Ruminococcaceae bacterium]|nr:type II toxin-antitoxin system RelB/DinJ family antitoxin [Oscillospiraceae bacterium]